MYYRKYKQNFLQTKIAIFSCEQTRIEEEVDFRMISDIMVHKEGSWACICYGIYWYLFYLVEQYTGNKQIVDSIGG